jgi:hypothetical protein
MTTTEIIATISIVCAFTSATLVSYFNHRFGVKTKKLDILLNNRIVAFKAVTSKIVDFSTFCIGRIANLEGNEFSPFYEGRFGALEYRTDIAKSLQENSIFLSKKSRKLVKELINEMSGICNGEAAEFGKINEDNLKTEYIRMRDMSESAIDVLYQELGIGKL